MSGNFHRIGWRQIVLIIMLITAVIPAAAQPGSRLSESQYNILATVFSPDGKLLAISRGTPDSQLNHGQIDVWDIQAKKLQRVIRGFDGPVWSIAFLADSRTLISSSAESRAGKLKGGQRDQKFFREIKWWDVATGNLLRRQTSPTNELRVFVSAVSADGSLLANIEYYAQINTFLNAPMDSSTAAVTNTTPQAAPAQISIARTSLVDLNLLNAQTGDFRVESKNISRQDFIPLMSRPFRPRMMLPPLSASVVFSPTRNLLAVGMPDQIKVFDAATGEQKLKLKKFDGQASAVEFSAEGRTLAIASVTFKNKETDDRITTFLRAN